MKQASRHADPRPDTPQVTRRGFARWAASGAAVMATGAQAAAASGATTTSSALRDAMLRGLALAAHRGDPVMVRAADRALADLHQSDLEGALLLRLYIALDVRPASYFEAAPDADIADLDLLHTQIMSCGPIRFGYTDLAGHCTVRTVLPLALVHPPQGVKLLAWCEERGGYRQFFVRAMQGLTSRPGDFTARRMTLLEGLVDKEGA